MALANSQSNEADLLNDAMKDVDNNNTNQEAEPEKIFYNYLCKAYKVFLSGSDDFDEMVKELGSNFGNSRD